MLRGMTFNDVFKCNSCMFSTPLNVKRYCKSFNPYAGISLKDMTLTATLIICVQIRTNPAILCRLGSYLHIREVSNDTCEWRRWRDVNNKDGTIRVTVTDHWSSYYDRLWDFSGVPTSPIIIYNHTKINHSRIFFKKSLIMFIYRTNFLYLFQVS